MEHKLKHINTSVSAQHNYIKTPYFEPYSNARFLCSKCIYLFYTKILIVIFKKKKSTVFNRNL